MALQKTVTTPQGFHAQDAYHRVETIMIENKTKLVFQVRSYASAEVSTAFDDAAFDCAYDMGGSNPIQQAYQHLKGLPEFSGAEDV